MKAKNIIKIILDIIMSVLFTLLLFPYNTGLVFHEIMGLSVLFLFTLHIILNGKWVINISKNLFSKTIKAKTVWMYILNIGLLMGIIIITITGLMISNIVFHINDYNQNLRIIHKYSSYMIAVMIVVHLALHAKYLIVSFKKIIINVNTPIMKKVFGSALSIFIVVSIVYYNIISSTNKSVYSERTGITTNTDNNTQNNDAITSTSNIIKKEDEDETTINSSEDQTDVISLSEFLGKMFCTLCPRHCPLSHPQCGKSRKLIAEAKEEYQELYGQMD